MNRWMASTLAGLFLIGSLMIGIVVLHRSQGLRFPAEFEKQQAVWMQWPSEIYDSGSRPVSPVMANIIGRLAGFIRVNLMIRSIQEADRVKVLLNEKGYSGRNIRFFVVDHYSIWARDVGPIFVKDKNNKLNIVNFGFNNYSRGGNPDYIRVEGQVDAVAAGAIRLPVIRSTLISEGGAIESNGKGVLMLTASVVRKRNPGWSQRQIVKEYQRVLGIRKIIWLQKGLAEDDRITSGHINEFARFAGSNTILLGRVLPRDRFRNRYTMESYRRMEVNYRILQRATDQDGKRFRIIRIPMPPKVYAEADQTGETPVWSYLNYAVTNGAVLIQVYWKPGRSPILKTTEAEVIKTFQRVFPGRRIIGIDAENVNRWGGGIHCITQHMPANE